MRWSEMEAQLRKQLASPGVPAVYTADEILALFKRKAEAAGVTWEPEEEPLPERLEMRAGAIHDPEAGCPWVADPRMNYLGQKDTTKPAERVLAEMVRRYNAWPELERLAETMSRKQQMAGPNAIRRILESGK